MSSPARASAIIVAQISWKRRASALAARTSGGAPIAARTIGKPVG